MMNEFEDAIINLNTDKAISCSKELLSSSQVERGELFKAIGRALDVVGQKYEDGEFFLSELIMAGEVVKDILAVIAPTTNKEEQKNVATVVLATVKGDLHDIGKNILSTLFKSAGFKVVDLGIDVPKETITTAVKENNPMILGLSSLLSTTVPEFGNIILELQKLGLRDKVKVIVGGAAVNEGTVKKYQVDAWGKTAVQGLRIAKRWAGIGDS